MMMDANQPAVTAAFRVDASRGERIGRVSSEWFSRPDDERYLSLPDLYAAVRGRADRATARIVETVLKEEGRPPESVFDFVQGITALARSRPHQDSRLDLEAQAKRLLERAV